MNKNKPLYDFYYSKEFFEKIKKHKVKKTFFNGQQFTTAVKHREDFKEEFSDTIQIGIGTYEGVTCQQQQEKRKN